jgi:aldehyde dehydrogenase (NAD+)
MKRYDLHIDGEWVAPDSGRWFETTNPYDNEAWALIPEGNAADVDRAVRAAHGAFTAGPWPALTASARGALLRRLAELLHENADYLGELESRDNGKLLAECRAQMRYTAEWYHYYGGLADKVEGAVIPTDKPGVFNFTRYEPLGVVAAITPWNSPLMLATWKLAPALAAGNTVVIKPSEFTSATSLEFMKLVTEAGFPRGVVNVVTGFGREVGEPLVSHPLVAKIAFTGGEAAGRAINELAAKNFKKVILELGGKSPNIVFDDADLDQAVKGAIRGIFSAAGQSCVAGSRLLLHDSIHDRFVEQMVAIVREARIGKPADPATHIGPIATKAQLEKVLAYIDIARSEGATCVLGGNALTTGEFARGNFVEPTIFTHVTNDMRIAQEEVFGPVLSVIRFRDVEEAIRIANDINYGLAAGIWTTSLERAVSVSQRIKAGTVWVNTYRDTSYTSPFGGYKRSGIGREGGQEAIKDYLQVKSVWVSTGMNLPNPFVRQ